MISSDHADQIVWDEESEDELSDLDEEQEDRMFTFEVSKTNEQEENVTMRAGFRVSYALSSATT